MRNRALTYSVLLLGALIFLSACESGGSRGSTGARVPETKLNQTFMDKSLQVTAITGPGEDRTMVFTLKNIKGKPLEDLMARVVFYLPPTQGDVQQWDTDAVELPFSAFRDESIEIKARPNRGGRILGAKLYVESAMTVAREGSAEGSKFLDGALECVGIADRLTAMKPSLSFDVKNVSGAPLELLEFRVRLTKGGDSDESDWQPFPKSTIQPGETLTLVPDLGNVRISGVANVLLKIQQSVL